MSIQKFLYAREILEKLKIWGFTKKSLKTKLCSIFHQNGIIRRKSSILKNIFLNAYLETFVEKVF